MDNYLNDLQARLTDGIARQPAALRQRHARFLRQRQNPDGGFSGREGDSDLYYTGFALRGLAILDALTPAICGQAAGYLRGSLTSRASVVDLFSLLYACLLVQASGGPNVLADSAADWPDRVAATLETFRTSDGGYNKSPGATAASTYHTFLVGLCYQLLGRPVPRPDDLVRFVTAPARRRRFRRGRTDAPQRHEPHGGRHRHPAACTGPRFAGRGRRGDDRVSRRHAGHGRRPARNDRVPLSDLLSTFTGCWTLAQLGALERIDLPQVAAFAHAVELPEGGFRGGLWDEATDVEYTFYGLGVLALT